MNKPRLVERVDAHKIAIIGLYILVVAYWIFDNKSKDNYWLDQDQVMERLKNLNECIKVDRNQNTRIFEEVNEIKTILGKRYYEKLTSHGSVKMSATDLDRN